MSVAYIKCEDLILSIKNKEVPVIVRENQQGRGDATFYAVSWNDLRKTKNIRIYSIEENAKRVQQKQDATRTNKKLQRAVTNPNQSRLFSSRPQILPPERSV